MPTLPPLYRFPLGTQRGTLFSARKEIIGDIDATCLVDAVTKVASIHAGDPRDIEVLEMGVKRQSPTGEWVPTTRFPETRTEAELWASDDDERKEADGVPHA